MPVTRSSAADRTRRTSSIRVAAPRRLELPMLLTGSLLVAAALALTYNGRLETLPAPPRSPINLSAVERAEQLLPTLDSIESAAERQYVGRKVFEAITAAGGELPNVGAIGRIRVPVREAMGTRGLTELHARARNLVAGQPEAQTVVLLSGAQLGRLKPLLSVRDLGTYRWRLLLWAALFFTAFYSVHLFWTIRGSRVSEFILPALQVLSGIGFALMIALRDPLRDTLAFADFAGGVVLGCVALAACSLVDYERHAGRLSWIPLLASFILSVALIAFGSGPGGSDAKVNLLGFQPAELIRILLVFFLAGYFARRWEFLRTLRENRPELERVSKWVEVPRLEYLLPVLAGVVVSLAFFFLQKDLGPALIMAALFLAMYAIARDRYLFAVAGLLLILAGFGLGALIGYPATVSARVAMWLSPWDNAVRGGEQVVHSLWSFATGGIFGTGLGLGDPEIMPAAHTDLIFAALAEEWGFAGFLAVIVLYAALVWFGIRTALRARSDYNFFLAVGLTLALALQIALIGGGVLDLLPLSGVVTPFLSYGKTALITNFAIVGMLLALGRDGTDPAGTQPFRSSTRAVVSVLGVFAALLVAKAAYVQILRADATLGAGALTLQADGFRRYQYNPRLLSIAASIPRGAIFDRNGLPLASSNWAEIAAAREAYARMGVALPQQPSGDPRYYPLGAWAVHLLGDLRTRANWGARNSSLAERDFAVTLQGYDDRATVVEVPHPRTGKPTYTVRYDYRELMPLVRHRYQPDHPEVRRIRERDRNLRMSIDGRLQVQTSRILEQHLKRLGRKKGSAVVMDAVTGDLLASVSYPWPTQMPPTLAAPDADDTMLDRARYGLYPPGSTFKLVTAIAALRRDPGTLQQQYECRRLPDGRVGNFVRGWSRPIRDDVKDTVPHGAIAMERGTIVSCNAYFAQLATYRVGAEALHGTARLLGIDVAKPNTPAALRDALPQAGYGQGQVVATPFQMARVAATVAANGNMPFGRWVIDGNNPRIQPPEPVLHAQHAGTLARYMRGVVTSGTGRAAAASSLEIAGKTGTAELERAPSHAWFVGFAPVTGRRRLAFAVLVENGQYGGSAAAPIAAEIMNAARQLGLAAGGGE